MNDPARLAEAANRVTAVFRRSNVTVAEFTKASNRLAAVYRASNPDILDATFLAAQLQDNSARARFSRFVDWLLVR